MVQIPILDLGPAPCLFLSTQAPPTCCSNLLFLARSNQSAERAATLPASEGGSMLEQLFRADPNMFLPWRSQGSREKPTQARGEGVTPTQKSTSLDLTSDLLLCNIVAIQRLSVRNPRRLGDHCWSQLITWEAAFLWLNSSSGRMTKLADA